MPSGVPGSDGDSQRRRPACGIAEESGYPSHRSRSAGQSTHGEKVGSPTTGRVGWSSMRLGRLDRHLHDREIASELFLRVSLAMDFPHMGFGQLDGLVFVLGLDDEATVVGRCLTVESMGLCHVLSPPSIISPTPRFRSYLVQGWQSMNNRQSLTGNITYPIISSRERICRGCVKVGRWGFPGDSVVRAPRTSGFSRLSPYTGVTIRTPCADKPVLAPLPGDLETGKLVIQGDLQRRTGPLNRHSPPIGSVRTTYSSSESTG